MMASEAVRGAVFDENVAGLSARKRYEYRAVGAAPVALEDARDKDPAAHPEAPQPLVAEEAHRDIEAEYALEHPVRCNACGDTVVSLKAVRLLRTRVNFTSTLPRRGRVLVCPACHAMVPAELTNF